MLVFGLSFFSLPSLAEDDSAQAKVTSKPELQLPRDAYIKDGRIFLEHHEAPAPYGLKAFGTEDTQAETSDHNALREEDEPSSTEGGE